MPTVNSRKMVDQLIAARGRYPGDSMRVVRIIEYTNAWGGTAYGLVYEGMPWDAYQATEFVRNPKELWRSEDDAPPES